MSPNIKEFYEYFASDEQEQIGPYRTIRLQNFLSFLTAKESDKLLDIACGTGIYAQYFSDCCEVVAVDISTRALGKAKVRLQDKIRYGKVHLVLAEASNLPFRDRAFDKILSSDTLEHVPEVEKCLNEFSRALKLNGRLVVYTGCEANPLNLQWFFLKVYGYDRINIAKGHINSPFFSTKYHTKVFRKIGLEIERLEYLYHYVGCLFQILYDLMPGARATKLRSGIIDKILFHFLTLEHRFLKRVPLGSGIFIFACKAGNSLKCLRARE